MCRARRSYVLRCSGLDAEQAASAYVRVQEQMAAIVQLELNKAAYLSESGRTRIDMMASKVPTTPPGSDVGVFVTMLSGVYIVGVGLGV